MMKVVKNKPTLFLFLFIGGVLIALGVIWIYFLQKAHSSFDNYYAFRGCTELLVRADTYGTCRLSSGQVIKIVKFQNKWYLDGDLPCKTGICL